MLESWCDYIYFGIEPQNFRSQNFSDQVGVAAMHQHFFEDGVLAADGLLLLGWGLVLGLLHLTFIGDQGFIGTPSDFRHFRLNTSIQTR